MAFIMKKSSPILQTIMGTTISPSLDEQVVTAKKETEKFVKRPHTKEEIRKMPTKGTKLVDVPNADINKLSGEQVNQAADSAMSYMGRNLNFTITPGNTFKNESYKGVEAIRANTFKGPKSNNSTITKEQVKNQIKSTGNASVVNNKFVTDLKPFYTKNVNPQSEATIENNVFVKDSTIAANRLKSLEIKAKKSKLIKNKTK